MKFICWRLDASGGEILRLKTFFCCNRLSERCNVSNKAIMNLYVGLSVCLLVGWSVGQFVGQLVSQSMMSEETRLYSIHGESVTDPRTDGRTHALIELLSRA